MGRYDDITPEQLRTKLRRFARLVLKLEEKDMLLEKSPALLKLLGELRQMLFAWEVRGTRNLTPKDEEDEAGPGAAEAPQDEEARESMRIVREALEREEELRDELRDRFLGGEED